MAKKVHFDCINVIDCEATCWENHNIPDGETQEIIEIGICELSIKSLEIKNKTQILIHPTVSNVSEFCSDLTGLTQKKLLEEGVDFAKACEILKNRFNSRKRVWASYGEWDRRMFQNQCELFEVDNPLNYRHLNIKMYLPIVFALSKECGLQKALEFCGMAFEGTHHVGADDAFNTARILKEIIRGGVAYGG